MNAARKPILLYHHVERAASTPPPRFASSYLPLAEFRAQLDSLARRGVRTLTLSEAVTRERSERGVVLTFDDGCRCFADVVAPELAERGMTATLFAVAGLLGASNRWDEERGERREELLDAAELRRLADQGIEIGCHSRTHRDLAGASADQLAAEIGGAKRELEKAIGRPVSTFCYPRPISQYTARHSAARDKQADLSRLRRPPAPLTVAVLMKAAEHDPSHQHPKEVATLLF